MFQNSDIKNRLADAEQAHKNLAKANANPATQASKIGEDKWEGSWRKDMEKRSADSLSTARAQMDFVNKARGKVDTGKSPLSSPMQGIKK